MEEGRSFIGKRRGDSPRKRSFSQLDSAKRARHYSMDYDSRTETSEPIDTLYRILCPLKKIGSVLGKGGDIVNALRDETHAKIRVSEVVPGSEERVIIIFSYPSDGSQAIDDNQDAEKLSINMEPHCPAQNALLKVHDRVIADEYMRGGIVHHESSVDDDVIARILVPGNQVGCLLGKGGTIIQKLRSETRASIRILPADHLPTCAMRTDELVQITGKPPVVKKALYEVSSLLHKHPHKQNPPLEDLIYASRKGGIADHPSLPSGPHGRLEWEDEFSASRFGLPVTWSGEKRNGPPPYHSESHVRNNDVTTEEFSMKILCATHKIGGVIGKGGVNVRILEDETGASIKIEDTHPEAEERVVLVSSKEDPWHSHSSTIEAVLQLQSRTSTISDEGNTTIRLLVPSHRVGCLLGQGGDVINEMRMRTKADIQVFSKKDKPKYVPTNEELVQISGNHSVAMDVLSEVSSRLRTRTFQSSNAVFVSRSPLGRFSWEGPPSGMPNSGSAIPYEPFKGARRPYESPGYRGLPDAPGYRSSAGLSGYTSAQSGAGYHGMRSDYSLTDIPMSKGYVDRLSDAGYSNSQDVSRFSDLHSSRYTGRSTETYFGGLSSDYTGLPPASEYYRLPPSGHHGSPTRTGYANIIRSEMKIPNSAVASVLGSGGSNLSEIRQISGARLELRNSAPGDPDSVIEIHGTTDETRAAESLLQAFLASGHTSPPPASQGQPRYY